MSYYILVVTMKGIEKHVSEAVYVPGILMNIMKIVSIKFILHFCSVIDKICPNLKNSF